ncbi:MAG: 50S ribosomal protein L35 [Alphaproteobacteria bacterium]|jgi:large subunit ribosomal protein L35|nr:50S ribosomal protein L35 [Thalassospira sp.]MCE2965730.1 50S ribosomal protein L35 [Alphaproteobacteria bacterium]
MPKLKTKSGAKKRFKATASGKIKAFYANKRHCLTAKPTKMKRSARGTFVLTASDAKIVRKYHPYI